MRRTVFFTIAVCIISLCVAKELCRTAPVDLILLLDASNSLNPNEWKSEVNFAKDLVKKFDVAPDKNHVGIVAFHRNPVTYLDLVVGTNSTTVEEVLKTLGDNDKPGTELGKDAYTMTDKGLDTAYRMFKRAKKRRNVDQVLVVVTDGRTTSGTEKLSDPLTDLKMLKVTRFAVGVGDKVDENELNLIANDKEHVAMVDNFDGFNKAFARLKKTICRPLKSSSEGSKGKI